jgi:MerR family copper efflux transcriptional regulator
MRNEHKPTVTMKLLTIGKVAKLSGVGAETIRFYERVGALPEPKRKASGYRLFEPDIVRRIQFIRHIQDLGFSLKEAGDLASSRGISAVIRLIDRRVQELKDLQRELRIQLRPNGK